MKSRICKIGVLLIASVATLEAQAQEGNISAKLPEVVVHGDDAPATANYAKERKKLDGVPGGTNLIDVQGANTRQTTLRDALDYQPGIVVQEFFGAIDQPRLNIRGSGIQSNPVNRGVLLLQDGMPLNEADGSFIIGLLEPRSSAFISVRRGANAISPNATTLGGELDFRSLTAYDTDGMVRLEGGSHGRKGGYVAKGWRGESLDGLLSISHDRTNGYRHHSNGKRTRVQGNAGFKVGGVENRTYFSWADLNFKIPTVVPKERVYSDPHGILGEGSTAQDRLLNVYKRDPRREARQWRLANKTAWGADDRRYELGVYWQHTDDLFNNQTSHTKSDTQTFGALWNFSGRYAAWDYRFAAAWSRSNMDRSLYATNPQNGTRMQRFGDYDLMAENRNLAADLTYRLAAQWSLVGSLKWSSVVRNAKERGSGNRLDQDWNYFTPKVGVNWTPAQDLRLFMNISRSQEAPTYWEIIADNVAPNNPGGASSALTRLKLQKANTLEVGGNGLLELVNGKNIWSLTLYRSHVDDEIMSTVDATGVNTGTFNYIGKTRHTGLEAGLSGRLPAGPGRLDYRVAYTWSDFKFRNGEYAGNQIAGVPRHLVSAEFMYVINGWRVGPNLRWLPSNTPTDHMNTRDIEQNAYAVWGFKLAYDYGSHWSAFLQIDNVTNKRYASSYAIRRNANLAAPGFLPGMGLNAVAGVNYQF